jgi:hypothetical protein
MLFIVANLIDARKPESRPQRELGETHGFPSASFNGFGFAMFRRRPPQAIASGRQRSGYLRQALFMTFSEKRV